MIHPVDNQITLEVLAYLDPGSGSYLLQLLIASLMGGLLIARAYWGRIRGFFGRLFGRTQSDEKHEDEG